MHLVNPLTFYLVVILAGNNHYFFVYEDAGRRWLLSPDGQQWLQSRGLSFP